MTNSQIDTAYALQHCCGGTNREVFWEKLLITIAKGVNDTVGGIGGSVGTRRLRSGTGNLPLGLVSVDIIKTSAGGTVDITTNDGTFTMTQEGEVWSVPHGPTMPAVTVADGGGATHKWIGFDLV